MRPKSIARVTLWTGAFALIWWGLAGPDGGGWYAGVIGIAAATLAHTALSRNRAPSLHPIGLAVFVPFFIVRMIRGGLDVSARAVSSGPRIDPTLLRYRIGLPPGAPTTLFLNSISLMPGTFSAKLEGDEVIVHILASSPEARRELARLESRVGGVFGIDPAGAGE